MMAATKTNRVDIQSILDNVKQVSMSPSSMETVCEFERVIDENGLYAFHHWKDGELVSGPNISAYRVICTFCWPLEKMPDPAGAQRLLSYGVKVYYKKAWLVYPIKIKSEDDFRPTIKKPKLARIKVWLVTINMPKYLIKEIKQSSKEIIDQEMDMGDINDTYEQNISPDENPNTGMDTTNQQAAPISPAGF
jgi:hypothetical protein